MSRRAAALADRCARAALVAVSLGAIAACARVIVGRIAVPVESEWMTGAVLDHIARVRDGEALYPPPGEGFIPFVYPPGYYAVAAAVAHLLPLRWAARLVSLAASLATAFAVERSAAHLGADRTERALAVGLYAGAFSYVGFWYDLERADPLAVALSMAALSVAMRRDSVRAAAWAGAIGAAAFFVKQPAAAPVLAMAGGLVWARQGRSAAALLACFGAVTAVVGAALQRATHGGFGWYVLHLPRAHGIDRSLRHTLWNVDLPLAAVLAAGVLGVLAVAAVTRGSTSRGWRLLASFAVGGGVATALSRLHPGGWINVRIFAVAPACVATALSLGALRRAVEARGVWYGVAARAVAVAAVVWQLDAWAYEPGSYVPSPGAVVAWRALRTRIQAMEARGPVWVLGRGGMTRVQRGHLCALHDVIHGDGRVPPRVRVALSEGRFEALVFDNLDDVPLVRGGTLLDLALPGYFIAEHLDDPRLVPLVGCGSWPRWVLRRRAHPLDPRNRELLRCYRREEERLVMQGTATGEAVEVQAAQVCETGR